MGHDTLQLSCNWILFSLDVDSRRSDRLLIVFSAEAISFRTKDELLSAVTNSVSRHARLDVP